MTFDELLKSMDLNSKAPHQRYNQAAPEAPYVPSIWHHPGFPQDIMFELNKTKKSWSPFKDAGPFSAF